VCASNIMHRMHRTPSIPLAEPRTWYTFTRSIAYSLKRRNLRQNREYNNKAQRSTQHTAQRSTARHSKKKSVESVTIQQHSKTQGNTSSERTINRKIHKL